MSGIDIGVAAGSEISGEGAGRARRVMGTAVMCPCATGQDLEQNRARYQETDIVCVPPAEAKHEMNKIGQSVHSNIFSDITHTLRT